MVSDNRLLLFGYLSSQLEGCRGEKGGRCEKNGRGGGWGGGGRAAAHTWQQLSALYFICDIIKDDYRLPFWKIIMLWYTPTKVGVCQVSLAPLQVPSMLVWVPGIIGYSCLCLVRCSSQVSVNFWIFLFQSSRLSFPSCNGVLLSVIELAVSDTTLC